MRLLMRLLMRLMRLSRLLMRLSTMRLLTSPTAPVRRECLPLAQSLLL